VNTGKRSFDLTRAFPVLLTTSAGCITGGPSRPSDPASWTRGRVNITMRITVPGDR
jgi:hypothetical protein